MIMDVVQDSCSTPTRGNRKPQEVYLSWSVDLKIPIPQSEASYYQIIYEVATCVAHIILF